MKNCVYGLVGKFALPFLLFSTVSRLHADPATLLMEEHFNYGIPGWTTVQPQGTYAVSGPLLWQYDPFQTNIWENSNLFSGSSGAAGSATRLAAMLINETVAPANFTYTARLTAGDDDGFGLVFGYQSENTFYRVTFARETPGGAGRTGWPYTGWNVDRMDNGVPTDLFGAGISNISGSFTNTTTRPFDVTIGVDNGLFSLTVVDNPTVSPVTWNLVSSQPLPASAGGNVGAFAWGMSGGTPSGFRIGNLGLSPTPLAGTTNPIPVWTQLATQQPNGNTNGNLRWVFVMNTNGMTGGLRENGDNQFANNTVSNRVDFASSAVVAGDASWTDYIYSARLKTGDDDGFGLLLRYQNETNFYRIALRSQAGTAGVKQGLSIQKSIDGVFSEIAESTTFIPPNPATVDVYAAIRNNTLQVVAVNNPGTSTAQTYNFGPYEITDGTVNSGKVGVFAWAMNYVEIDSMKVEEVAGEGLLVTSAFGNANPPVGLNDFAPGTIVTASVESVLFPSPGTRRVSTGWDGSGSVPASGTTNSVTFTLANLSFLNWKWETQHELTLSVTGNGQILNPPGTWIVEGTNITLTAQPDPGNIFLGWTGNRSVASTDINLTMNRPLTLTANFAPDSDGDGLSDTWETNYFGNLAQTGAGDPDSDGFSNAEEFARGSHPNFAETLAVADAVSSQWEIGQRITMGTAGVRNPIGGAGPRVRVVDFGGGYRGAFEDSNQHVSTTNPPVVPFASFETPTFIVRSNVWNDSWSTNFSAQIEFSVGDDDGNCLYFRYQNPSNYYRATVCGTGGANGPRVGLSLQKCENDTFSEIGGSGSNIPEAKADPTDITGYKRFRLTVNGTNDTFEVKFIGWNWLLSDFDPGSERSTTFSDSSFAAGRIGFGYWAQQSLSGGGATNGIPVGTGSFADNIFVNANGAPVFTETWETAALTNEFPAGWTNAYAASSALEGNWRMTVDGITQMANVGPQTTGTATLPKANADAPIFLAPSPGVANYLLSAGMHTFNTNGVGLVYDFQDQDNFARVMFAIANPGNGRMPQGMSVSRKTAGVWSDILVETNFVFARSRPFVTELSVNSGNYILTVRDFDNPANVYHWRWTDTAAAGGRRFGLTAWSSPDAHFFSARALNLSPQVSTPVVTITGASIVGNNIVLTVSRQDASAYNVERTSTLGGGWTSVATNQTGAQYSEPLSGEKAFYRLIAVP